MNAKVISLLILCIVVINSCIKAPSYSNVPELEFVNMSKDTLIQNGIDSFYITIGFKDGDNDISAIDTFPNLFLSDSRTSFSGESPFLVPLVTNLGTSNSIKGEIRIKVGSSCCIYNQSEAPCTSRNVYQSMFYKIYLKDRAGHESNTISTPPIVLKCLF